MMCHTLATAYLLTHDTLFRLLRRGSCDADNTLLYTKIKKKKKKEKMTKELGPDRPVTGYRAIVIRSPREVNRFTAIPAKAAPKTAHLE